MEEQPGGSKVGRVRARDNERVGKEKTQRSRIDLVREAARVLRCEGESIDSSTVMVELCGVIPDVDEWPSDMDARVAQLDFADSVLSFDPTHSTFDPSNSTFDPSLSTFDPSLSTDSLDSEQLRQRCIQNKEDYKLTFADSGQWTSTHFTTWGRIQNTQPSFNDKVASAPDVLSSGSHRPSSLLIDFVGRQMQSESPLNRFVDMNENEIRGRTTQEKSDRWRHTPRIVSPKTKRTFADLGEQPDLPFLALPHQTRALCESSPDAMTPSMDLNLSCLADASPDSGLGCSGPIHIEDWPSLSILLPRHVAEACSFFKRNSELLGVSNCVERSRTEPCTTCFRVRRRFHPPVWAHSTQSRVVLCDCASSEIIDRTPLSIRGKELAVVGLPVYSTARSLVEAVVEAVAISVRGEGEDALCEALNALIENGIKDGIHPWNVIQNITAPGPATKNVHTIVMELSASDRSNDAKVHVFFQELLRQCSVECWLCYVLLKENVLRDFYRPSSFLLSAPSAYRSLLARLLESLQLLSIHDSRLAPSASWGSACRIPSDSRVPKSSSVPARLSPLPVRPRSRIPTLRRRTTCSFRASQLSSVDRHPVEARIRADSALPGQLVVRCGERVRVLSQRGNLAHCWRVKRCSDLVQQGIVPLSNLLIL